MSRTSTPLKARIAELEAEVLQLKSQVEELTPKKDWWNHIEPEPATPENIKAWKEYDYAAA